MPFIEGEIILFVSSALSEPGNVAKWQPPICLSDQDLPFSKAFLGVIFIFLLAHLTFFCILGIHSKAIFARLDARKFLAQYSSFSELLRFNSEKERLELASQKAEQEVLLLSHLQKLRIDTKYFRKLLSHGINSVEQFQENLDSVRVPKEFGFSWRTIFENDDLLKLQDAAPRKVDQFAPLRSENFPLFVSLTRFNWPYLMNFFLVSFGTICNYVNIILLLQGA